MTGQYLGAADLNPNNDGSATATWTGYAQDTANYNLGIGSYSIIAVYNGDSNFTGSQSSGTAMTVDGNGLSISGLAPSSINEGTTASLSGTVSGLNGAAFSVTVNWGDGQSGDSDNGGQPFYFAAGTTSFSVNHYYGNCGSDTISNITVTASDGRQLSLYTAGGTGLPLTVNGVAPIVYLDPPLPAGENYDPGTQYTVSAYGVSPDPSSVSYQWVLSDGTALAATPTTLTLADGTVLNGSEVQVWGDQYGGVNVTVSSGGAARMVNLGNPNFSQGFVDDTASLPAVTITETDPNQTVTAPGVATFDVQAQWAAGTQYWFPSVFYNTIDASGAAPAGYVSTYGPQQVCFGQANYDSATGTWSEDATITVQTNSVIDDGATNVVTVQLTHPLLCQIAGNAGATSVPQAVASNGGSVVCQAGPASGGGGRAMVDVLDPQFRLFLTTDVEYSDFDVTNNGSQPVSVEAGESLTVTAEVGGQLVHADWKLGNGQAIGFFDDANGQVEPIVGSGGGSQVVSSQCAIAFEWVAGGTYSVTATFGGTTVTASFAVQSPQGTGNLSMAATPTFQPGRTNRSAGEGYAQHDGDVAAAGEEPAGATAAYCAQLKHDTAGVYGDGTTCRERYRLAILFRANGCAVRFVHGDAARRRAVRGRVRQSASGLWIGQTISVPAPFEGPRYPRHFPGRFRRVDVRCARCRHTARRNDGFMDKCHDLLHV